MPEDLVLADCGTDGWLCNAAALPGSAEALPGSADALPGAPDADCTCPGAAADCAFCRATCCCDSCCSICCWCWINAWFWSASCLSCACTACNCCCSAWICCSSVFLPFDSAALATVAAPRAQATSTAALRVALFLSVKCIKKAPKDWLWADIEQVRCRRTDCSD